MFLRFDPAKFRVYLKLAIERLKNFQLKQESLNANARREIATLLEKKKDELARIKTEQLIRDDYLIDASGILEVFCTLLLARCGLLEASRQCDPSLKEAVQSLIWASPRMQGQVPELKQISKGLEVHFGLPFSKDALENRDNFVNVKLLAKLSIARLNPAQVEEYLAVIADKYKIEFTRQNHPLALDDFDPASAFGSRIPPSIMPTHAPMHPDFANPLYSSPMPSGPPSAYPAAAFDPLGSGAGAGAGAGSGKMMPGAYPAPYPGPAAGAYSHGGYPGCPPPTGPYPGAEGSFAPLPMFPSPPDSTGGGGGHGGGHGGSSSGGGGFGGGGDFFHGAPAPYGSAAGPGMQPPSSMAPSALHPSAGPAAAAGSFPAFPFFPSPPGASQAGPPSSHADADADHKDFHLPDVPQAADNVSPHLDLPSVPGGSTGGAAGGAFEWDDLERRFEALRKQK